MSLQEIVGKETYTVWVKMLQQLAPDGRTHRLAPLVAAMLQYASNLAYEEYGDNPEEGSVAQVLLEASETDDLREGMELLSKLVEGLFEDAGVGFERTSSQGDDYSIAKEAVYEFIHWYDMPWEA